MAALFAATYPERTIALVLCGPIRGGSAERHPAGQRWFEACRRFQAALESWGTARRFPSWGPALARPPASAAFSSGPARAHGWRRP